MKLRQKTVASDPASSYQTTLSPINILPRRESSFSIPEFTGFFSIFESYDPSYLIGFINIVLGITGTVLGTSVYREYDKVKGSFIIMYSSTSYIAIILVFLSIFV